MRILLSILFLSLLLNADKIESYHTELTIDKSGSVEIVEQIAYDFGSSHRHGIVRHIPYLEKLDQAMLDIGLHVVSVVQDGYGAQWQEKRPKHIADIRIGDPTVTVGGLHQYEIVYRIEHAVIPSKTSSDMIRIDLIPTEWDVEIAHASATIHFPPQLTTQNVHATFYHGGYGNSKTLPSHWQDSHTLQIDIGQLHARQGVTGAFVYPMGMLEQTTQSFYARLAKHKRILEMVKKQKKKSRLKTQQMIKAYEKENLIHRGTYTKRYKNIYIFNWLLEHFFLVILVFVGYLYLVHRSFGLRVKRSIVVEYLPPKGYSLLQSGILLDKYADVDDVSAAIIELAQLGYIEISQEEDVPVLTRLDKPSTDLSSDQKYLLEQILFAKEKKFEIKNKTNAEAITISKAFKTLTEDLYSWIVDNNYLRSDTAKIQKHFVLVVSTLAVLVFWLLYYILMLTHDIDGDLCEKVLTGVVIVAGMSLLVWGMVVHTWVRRLVVLPLGVLWTVMLGVHLLFAHDTLYLWQFWMLLGMGLVLVVSIYLSVERLGHYTPRGVALRRHLLGLREFIQRADAERIEYLLAQDPDYLERTLPYAILFGLTEHWLEQFALHSVSMPSWQSSSVNVSTLKSSMMHTRMVSSSSSGTYSSGVSSSYSGGGYSGSSGGYSGGGMGGGGGSTW